MRLVFVCPRTGKDFYSDHYRVVENQGVRVDAQGRRILDARVVLTDACPFCGETHGYRADELACPFGS